MTWSFLMQEFVEGIAELVWQSGIFLELWGRVVVNPSSCFVNLWETSTAFLSSFFIKHGATFASACLNGEITLKWFMMRWKSVLTSRCSISTWDYGRTTCGAWPARARIARTHAITEDVQTSADQACLLKTANYKCSMLLRLTVPVLVSLQPREFESPWMSVYTGFANKPEPETPSWRIRLYDWSIDSLYEN